MKINKFGFLLEEGVSLAKYYSHEVKSNSAAIL